MSTRSDTNLLDYRLLRLLVGLIALCLPPIVSILSKSSLPSISSAYYTGARDAFVGLLFATGTFLIAYNGKSSFQALMSKIAAIAAIIASLFPTSIDPCKGNLTSKVHYVAATTLFLILIYFCFVFYQSAKNRVGRKKIRRMNIYLMCGIIMVVSVAGIAIALIAVPCPEQTALRIIYWGETVALEAFGFAWLVAGKWKGMSIFVDPEDSYKFGSYRHSRQAGSR